jgi:hypothetical protein
MQRTEFTPSRSKIYDFSVLAIPRSLVHPTETSHGLYTLLSIIRSKKNRSEE